MSEKIDSVPTKHTYEIVTVHLKTGDVLRLAQNGTGLFHDLYIDGTMHTVTIPPENVKKIVPYPLPYTNEDPEKTLQEFYLDIVVRELHGYQHLKACVITQESQEFEKVLSGFESMHELETRGGISVDDLLIHERWKFIAILVRNFIHLPLLQKGSLEKMLAKKSPENFELSKQPRFPKEAYL